MERGGMRREQTREGGRREEGGRKVEEVLSIGEEKGDLLLLPRSLHPKAPHSLAEVQDSTGRP